QVHGGMGYIEETGAAQILRDARITAIYEGTTGIQAGDLVGRKLGRDHGAAMTALLDEIQSELDGLEVADAANTAAAARAAALEGVQGLRGATRSLVGMLGADPARAAAVAVPYLELAGLTLGGWLMARAAAIAARKLTDANAARYTAKLQTARFYAAQMMPRALALRRIVDSGAASVTEADAQLV
ncbi:MAG: acyl-CoA dehydrogenase C-terminal domain-containing protein, partial [Steroidobacteraceae bacterium]